MNYYKLPQVSNSDLSALMIAFYCIVRQNLDAAFAFGTLVDALLTDRNKVDFVTRRVTEDDGNVIQYDEEIFRLGQQLADNLHKDPVVRGLIDASTPQYIFARRLKFQYDGEEYEIDGRCKFDLFSRTFKIGTEFKTTSCTTEKSFIESIEHFDYDRAAAWYMDLARIDRMWIIGISKKNGKIFKFAIVRGDETYMRGLRKYSLWAYRWVTYCTSFVKHINLMTYEF